MTAQPAHSSVLLLDDGELDSVYRLLKRLGTDVKRLQGKDVGSQVPCPRDLIVASVKRCLDMPELEQPPIALSDAPLKPNWVCVHSQDFLPLRERLRDLGVHFLVHGSLDQQSLRLFLLQMLYSGPERRSRVRLPLGTVAFLLEGGNRKPVRLAELSAESCRIITNTAIGELAPVELALCESVAGGEELRLEGVAIRCNAGRSKSGGPLHSTVVSLEALDAETRAKLERIVGGGQIGTPVSPLASREEEDSSYHEEAELELAERPSPESFKTPERRESVRHEYGRRVELVELYTSSTDGSALGKDLSLTGIRVVGYPEMDPGSEVTLALYGGTREEPIVVRAEVVRSKIPEEVAFRFGELSESQHRGIAKLMAGQPALASVDSDDRVIMTRLID